MSVPKVMCAVRSFESRRHFEVAGGDCKAKKGPAVRRPRKYAVVTSGGEGRYGTRGLRFYFLKTTYWAINVPSEPRTLALFETSEVIVVGSTFVCDCTGSKT